MFRLILATIFLLVFSSAQSVLAETEDAIKEVTKDATKETLSDQLSKLKLPEGFSISVWARVPHARSLSKASEGRLFVGSRTGNQVHIVQDGKVSIFAEGLDTPNGVAYRDGKLYVAEISSIKEFDASPGQKLPVKTFRKLEQTFPTDHAHGWKFIRFGPDGMLYVPVGANCNICDPGTAYARIYKIDVAGKSKIEVAKGVRNTVGFDFHPTTNELWFTDNGRDWMGDDRPPCELNRSTALGQDFGFPYCHGKNVSDPEFGKTKNCQASRPPELELRAHVAPLGMRFYNALSFPEKYRGGIFIVEHGSWNRSTPQGYRITFAKIVNSKVVSSESFIDGWLDKEGKVWGRPVDMEIADDGSLLISDDYAGVIYKVTYTKK